MNELAVMERSAAIGSGKSGLEREKLNPTCAWCTEHEYCDGCLRSLASYFAREFDDAASAALAPPSWYLRQLGEQMNIHQAYELRSMVIKACRGVGDPFYILNTLPPAQVQRLMHSRPRRRSVREKLLLWWDRQPELVRLMVFALATIAFMGCLWPAVCLLSIGVQ